jgi:DNA-directed RNA polymerase subunit K/omega
MTETFSTLDETPATEPIPTETIPKSPYELVVIAAQEARRLNERWRRSTADHTEKVTKTAVDRVLAGQVHFLHTENP